MNRRNLVISLVALTLAATTAFIYRRAPLEVYAQEPAQSKRPGVGIREPQLQGAQSCANSACHGGAQLHKPRSEFTTWLSLDPHARAYDVLLNEKSQAIAAILWSGKMPAHEAPLCLKCHVDPNYDRARSAFRKQDGVGCESCHGAAEGWLHDHYRAGWQRQGMIDTKDLPTRARACVACHVGMNDNNLDHDLIAAGHPALRFEFATYYANLPRHWDLARSKDGDPGDFEARAWATGQLVTASRALELLAHRADSKTWPEFAEFDCFACHHDLQPSSWRQRDSKGRPGSLVPSDWYTAMLPEILDPQREQARGLLAEVRPHAPARDKLVASAKSMAASLHESAQKPVAADVLERLRLAARRDRSWDEATQHYLALLALQQMDEDRAKGADCDLKQSIITLRMELTFTPGFESPRLFVPSTRRPRE